MREDRHPDFASLSRAHVEGRDFRIACLRRGSGIAIVAPHGGRIERGTSDIARAIAGDDFDLYLFEGCMPRLNFETLHLTSTRFDEPRALALVAAAQVVVTIHGVSESGERALLGGRDRRLAASIADRLFLHGVRAVLNGHRFPGLDPRNLCNRGASGAGVQLELSDSLRGGRHESALVAAVRATLSGWGRTTGSRR